MRLRVLWVFLLTLAGMVRADEIPIDSLPQPVVETANENKGSGTIRRAESYAWGDATVYKLEIDLDGVPDLELQIGDNGKLIRIDRLRETSDESSDSSEDPRQ